MTERPSRGGPCCVCGDPVTQKTWARNTCDKPKCRYTRLSLQHPLLKEWKQGDLSADQTRGRNGLTAAFWARCFLYWETDWSCSRCGWCEPHPATGLPPLELDHIDGNTANNRRGNLRVLCPNCHALTPTFRRMNAKNNHYPSRQELDTVAVAE